MRYPTGHTHLFAIIGHPIAHVRASEFINPRFEQAKRDGFIIPFDIAPADLETVLPSLKRIANLKGFIVTIPHKPAMADLCDELGPAGKMIGAVNTVRIKQDGRLIGDMFDGLGLVEGARANGMEPMHKNALMIGCGGAGRAIAFALVQAGVKSLTLFNRTETRAQELASEIKKHIPSANVQSGAPDATGHDLIIQATSLGLHDEDDLPLDPNTLEEGADFIDIISVRDTPIMGHATRRGLNVIGGRPMVDHQISAQIDFLGAPML